MSRFDNPPGRRLRLAGCLPAILGLVAGCSGRPEGTVSATRPNATSASVVPAPHWSPEEQQAVDLAQAFLARQGTPWGTPERVVRGRAGDLSGVGKAEETLVVYYPTSASEQQVLGPRMVRVHVASGKAEMVPRD